VRNPHGRRPGKIQRFKGSTLDFSTLDASAEYEIRVQKLSLKPGLGYRRAVYDDTRYWDVTKDEGIFSGRYEVITHAASLRSEYSLWAEKLRLVGGLWLDKFNYPNRWFASYQLAATAKPSADHLLRAVYSRAYRSPFIYDNFIDLTLSLDPTRPNFRYQVNGSKDLDLVRSEMSEAGYQGKITGNLHVDAEVFYTQTRNYTDLITGRTEIRETLPVTVLPIPFSPFPSPFTKPHSRPVFACFRYAYSSGLLSSGLRSALFISPASPPHRGCGRLFCRICRRSFWGFPNGHEHVGQLVDGEVGREETPQFVVGDGSPFGKHDAGQGPLNPLFVRNGNHGGFFHLGVGHQGAFQGHARNPFPAALDEVFGPVGDLHVAQRVEGAHVARPEPAIGRKSLPVVGLVVAPDHPGPRTWISPTVLPSRGATVPSSCHHPHFHAGHLHALRGPDAEPFGGGNASCTGCSRATVPSGDGFRHAPGVEALQVEVPFEGAIRLSGSAEPPTMYCRRGSFLGRRVLLHRFVHAQPDGGHPVGNRNAFPPSMSMMAAGCRCRPGHHHVGAGQHAHEREAPGHYVELRAR
jgi:hypothetical protein